MKNLILILLFSNVILCQNYNKLENEPEIDIVSGPVRVVELEVDNVAQDYNNSVSTPITSYENYVYRVYVAADNPENTTEYYMQIHQIEIPEERVEGPYSVNASYNFVNNFGESDHELRVRDKVGENETTDQNHSAPSVGVDKDGYIHVLGGMHHGPDWEYCVSSEPNDISSFDCLDQDSDRLPPFTKATYPQFFKHTDGSLYLMYRSRFSNYWHPGTSFSVLAKYDENTKTWNALGSDNYLVGDLLDQDAQSSIKNEVTDLHELDLFSDWATSRRPESLTGLFYSDSGVYHRYYREPVTGEKIINFTDYSVSGYAYQAYWPSMKVDNTGRIHFSIMVYNKSNWDLASEDPDENADIKREYNVSKTDDSEPYIYSEKEFINNYTSGTSILYAYSDDGGETFYAPNGEQLDTPIAPHSLKEPNETNLRVNATVENGGIVRQDHSSKLFTSLWPKTEVSILPNGNPIIHFVESYTDGTDRNDFNSMIWDGQEWIESSSTRDSGAGGGMVSDATGGLWLFESQQATDSNSAGSPLPERMFSAGSKILYSNSGIDGSWEEIDSDWKNGNRVDMYQASKSNVLRYVEMDIQSGGTARIVSVRSSDNALSINDNTLDKVFTLYPNPASDIISISSQGEALSSIKMYNTLGKEVYTSTTELNSVDVSKFNKGIYFLKLEATRKTITKMILIN